ncbi:endospore germination permease [Paenibacillus sp. LHD-38]|uniref:GerAB/ArcD/ProY family transporter n=1 Tax=Paenibacillus sp. LHD-38 TaxID=3072143 RepID=UPI00280F921B|nr:endospore germination permease [Paenibacillus sp. LHD-38]MDQ8733519.1 endospore germination permease [Paenibacillus sp. LHD-38]
MQEHETVSSTQMATLFLCYLAGSSILFIQQPLIQLAKDMATLAVITANGIGFLLLGCVLYLHKQYPGLTYVEYSKQAVGRWLSMVFAILLIVELMLTASDIIRNDGAFVANTIMSATPVYVLNSLLLATAAITAYCGIEVMARMFVLLMITNFLFIVAAYVLNIPNYQVEMLFPLFTEGIKPFFYGTYVATGIPYAGLVVFGMLLPYVKQEDKPSLGKWMYGALVTHGITLLLGVICTIAVLGPLAAEKKYSLYVLSGMIEIADFVERLQTTMVFTQVVGSYMKTTIVLFILNVTLCKILQKQNERILIFPLTLVVLLLSLTAPNEQEASHLFTDVAPFVYTTLGVVPLLIIVLVTFIKQRIKRGRNR